MNFGALLKFVVENQGTDLFINVGAPPMLKVMGKMKPLGKALLTRQHIAEIINAILSKEQKTDFEKNLEIDLGYSVKESGRFRLNIYTQKGDPAIVARYIISDIPSISDLNLPLKLEEIVLKKRGLVLVSGATGTGKSTTLAAMIHYRNQQIAGHILTIEDPIEFLHEHNKSLISQREIGIDTRSYEAALINAMRESPDAILIGECRNTQTMKYAITFAETGHLCLTTLHANNASQVLDRVVNLFPEGLHHQTRSDLSEHLTAVVCQRLPIGFDGKPIPAVEILICTPYIRSLIREGQNDKIAEAMLQDTDDGSQTFDQALYGLYIAKKISKEEALKHADSADNLNLMIRFGD